MVFQLRVQIAHKVYILVTFVCKVLNQCLLQSILQNSLSYDNCQLIKRKLSLQFSWGRISPKLWVSLKWELTGRTVMWTDQFNLLCLILVGLCLLSLLSFSSFCSWMITLVNPAIMVEAIYWSVGKRTSGHPFTKGWFFLSMQVKVASGVDVMDRASPIDAGTLPSLIFCW